MNLLYFSEPAPLATNLLRMGPVEEHLGHTKVVHDALQVWVSFYGTWMVCVNQHTDGMTPLTLEQARALRPNAYFHVEP